MPYDESDAAEEAYYAHMLEQFRKDYSAEIADDFFSEEIVSAIIVAHGEWLEPTRMVLAKAQTRLDENEPEEAVFHAARAFEGYVRNVLVAPLKAAMVYRIQSSVPSVIEKSEDSVFRAINGLAAGARFIEIGISLITKDSAPLIKAFRTLTSGGNPGWNERNRVCHSPVSVDKDSGRAVFEQVRDILVKLWQEQDRLEQKSKARRDEIEFNRARIDILVSLADRSDRTPRKALREFELRLRSYESRLGADEELRTLEKLGYVQRLQLDDEGSPSIYTSDICFRLTAAGKTYFEEHVKPRLEYERPSNRR